LKKGEEGGDKEGGNWACGGPLPDPTHPQLQMAMKIMGLITPLDPPPKKKPKKKTNIGWWIP